MTCVKPLFYRHFDDIAWPNDAIFIVDDGLPTFISESLPHKPILVAAGEGLKSLTSIESLAESVLKRRSTRPMTLVAIGGGSLGDAVGFLASILWRGVHLWHVPTTLLAMVDSAHGGKTAVNLKGKKNQLGTFYPAQNVVICEEILNALPLDQREEGLTELVKALWLGAPDSLSILDDQSHYHRLLTAPVDHEQRLWQKLLGDAIAVKAQIVDHDPQERSGLRRTLNLGHTAGHALETLFQLPHGRAIAWGLAACLILSTKKANLSQKIARRLFAQIEPLLIPLPTTLDEQDRAQFLALVAADKKQEAGQLISILLDAPGRPVQTTDILPIDWWEALLRAQDRWIKQSYHVLPPENDLRPSPGFITLPADKSQANRGAIIAYLRPAPTTISAPDSPGPADMVDLSRALERLRSSSDPLHIQTGLGATTARFLLATAAARPGRTTLKCPPALLRRPHQPLMDALTKAGATIEPTSDGFVVQGWQEFPTTFEVSGEDSSQFASALALLAASGHAFHLHIKGPLLSRPYFELTLQMLEDAGVQVDRQAEDEYHLQPGPDFYAPHRIELHPDWSSAFFWHALAFLRPHFALALPEMPQNHHPDRRFLDILRALRTQNEQTLAIDLKDSPDLAPVLAALCAQLPHRQILFGAPHLRYKESNRIDDLAQSFADVGLTIEPTSEGLIIPEGAQKPRQNRTFDTYGDHRLVMAALLLASTTDGLTIKGAQSVIKSYPGLLRQLRRAGFQLSSKTIRVDSQ